MRRLAPRHREVLVLRYVAELSVDEVARHRQAPPQPCPQGARRSLAPRSNPYLTVSQDRRWVYFRSSLASQGIYRVPLAGGRAER